MAVFPPFTFIGSNRIVLIGRGRYEEAPASVACLPGHLIMDDAAAGFKPHNVAGGIAEMIFALEQGLQGIGGATTPIGAFDAYAVGTQVNAYVAAKGDLINCLVATGNNAAEGSLLQSNGDGTMKLCPVAQSGGNLYETVAASTALTNSTVETVFSNGSFNIPANFLQTGDILHVRAQGIATATNSTDTLTAKLYLGGLAGTNIVSTGALDVVNGDEFLIDAYIELRTIGNVAAGTFIANGMDSIGTPGTATVKNFLLGSTAVDTTVAQAIAVSGTWSVANAGDSCRLDWMSVDLIRQAGPVTPLMLVTSALDNTGGTTGSSYSPSALVQARVLR